MNSQSIRSPQNFPAYQPATTASWNQSPLANYTLSLPDKFLRSYARSKAQQGNYTAAIALLDQLIARHPEAAIDYNNRGLIYFQSGQLLRAVADYNIAIQLDPRLASAYNNRANYYAACGQLNDAIADYDRAIDFNPSYVRAWINRGITLRDLGQYEAAVENFDIAEVLGQLPENIYAERGRTHHLWGDWNYAIADYRRAIELLAHDSRNSTASTHLLQQVKTWLEELLGRND